MASIHLYVPQQTLKYSAYIDTRPRRTQAWLEALPAANLAQTSQMVRTALLETNKVKMSVSQRHALLTLFAPTVDRLAKGLRKQYISSPLPPGEEHLRSINLLHQCYASMANGYKVVVSEIQRSGKGMEAGNDDFMQGLRGAIEYLSLQLVQAYEVYFPEPKRVWGELHYLYLLAQRQQVADLPVSAGQRAGKVGMSIGDRYKRSVMITLANPYHLVQGECGLLYEKLAAWARQITLTSWSSGQCPSGRFFVDMGTDSAPRYAPSGMQLTPIYPFVVEVGDVLEVLKRLATGLKLGEGEGEGGRASFSDRKLRSMYERAAGAWGGRQERLGARAHGMSDTVMLMGLSNCYRLFAEVSPELDISDDAAEGQAKPKKKPKESGLRLMDIEEHVRQASVEAMTTVDGEEPQGTEEVVVGPEDTEVVFGNSIGDEPIMEEDTSRWRQRNQSQGGVSLFCFMDCDARVRVGELIAFRPSTSRWNEDWRVGAVRWIRVQPGQGLEMGVRTLSDDALAVRAKAVSGVGAGSSVNRSLMVPWVDPRFSPATLILPPAIFDEGTVMALELVDGTVIPIRLDTLVDSSDRYAQYRFSCLENPPQIEGWDVMK